MIRIALGPSSPFDSTPQLWAETAELADRLDVRLHTHGADPGEEAYCLERWGARRWISSSRPAGEAGALGSLTAYSRARTTCDGSAEWGTGVAHCPSSNSLICQGIAPVRELRRAGVPVGLGCDGSASTDHANLWLESPRTPAVAHPPGPDRHERRNVLEIATRGSAGCLGRSRRDRRACAGACGDLVAWPLEGDRLRAPYPTPSAWLRQPGSVHATRWSPGARS